MYCDECGTKIQDGLNHCPTCGKKIEVNTNTEMPIFYNETPNYINQSNNNFQNTNDSYMNSDIIINNTSNLPFNMSRSPYLGNLVFSENEVLVKQYHCSNVKKPKCFGFITVTNKRLLFQAEGQSLFHSRISKEISLDKITGVDCYYGTNINFRRLIIGIIMTLLGFSCLFQNGFSSFIKFIAFLFCVVGIILIIKSFRNSFKLTVYASECNPSPISVGEGIVTLAGNAVLYSIVSEPTNETDIMMNELGALVKDLQTMGDLALTKWKVN